MATPYIPNTDAGCRDWLNNFSSYVGTNFASLDLATGDATIISTAANAYNAAYLVAVNPSTRTRATVAAKDAAKAAALFTIRPYAMRINGTPAVTNLQRESLGLTVRDRNPTRIPAPVTNPLLEVLASTSGNQQVRFSDVLTPASRAKPFGVTSLQLFRTIGTTPATDPADASFVGNFTKNPLFVDNDAADAGKVATYFGRWTNRRGEVGPWSPAASLVMA